MQLLHANYCHKLLKHAIKKATTFQVGSNCFVSCRLRKLCLTVISKSCTVSLNEVNSIIVGECRCFEMHKE